MGTTLHKLICRRSPPRSRPRSRRSPPSRGSPLPAGPLAGRTATATPPLAATVPGTVPGTTSSVPTPRLAGTALGFATPVAGYGAPVYGSGYGAAYPAFGGFGYGAPV